MNRIERMAAILLLLQERPHSAGEIARRFEVSRRTVLRDVQALSEMGVPVEAREGPGGGYSLPVSYRAEPLPLTGKEAFLLLLALSAVEGMADLPFREEYATLRAKLRAQLPREELSRAESLMTAVGSGGGGSAPGRAPFLDALLQAAREGRWVRMVYQSSARISTVHLLPRQVYPQEGLWYLRAYTDEHQQERTYRVDRVQGVVAPEEGFSPRPVVERLPYDHESHPLITARLTPRGAALMEVDRDIGHRLRREEGGGAALSLRCPPEELPYFARLFSSLGGEIEVQSPPELRQMLKALGEKLVRRYS